jgi:hypothetical protein
MKLLKSMKKMKSQFLAEYVEVTAEEVIMRVTQFVPIRV